MKADDKLVASQLVGYPEKSTAIIRCSKYTNGTSHYFRISATESFTIKKIESNIPTVEKASDLFRLYQLEYFGEVRKELSLKDFI